MKKHETKDKAVGIERNLDNLGRVVIPKEMRAKLNFGENEKVSIVLYDNHIEIKKAENRCLFCQEQEDLKVYKNYTFCNSCLDNMKKEF